MWSTANTAAKLSILHLYIQIFCNRTFRHIALGVMALTCCYCATVFLETFLVCRPFAYNWDKTIVGGKCGNQPTIYFSAGLMNLLLDIVILVLPMPMLWGLKMPLFKKIALTAVFGMGAGYVISLFSLILQAAIFLTMPLKDHFDYGSPHYICKESQLRRRHHLQCCLSQPSVCAWTDSRRH